MEENKKKGKCCPIEFVPEGEDWRESPIEFIAKKKDEKGWLTEVVVTDERLAGMIIPNGYSEKEFAELYFAIFENGNLRDSKSNVVMGKCINSQVMKATDTEMDIFSLTNYDLLPYQKKIYVNREGKTDESRSEIVSYIKIVTNEGEKTEQFAIKCFELEKLTKIIGRKFNAAMLIEPTAKNEIENYFRKKTATIPTVICYTDAGWQKINGRWTYLHRDCKISGSEVMTSLNLPLDLRYSRQDVKKIWQKALEIYSDCGISSVLNVFAFLGVSYRLFDEAGYAPHFLLFLNGKTGSMKTTLSQILYTQLTDDRYRNLPRRIDADTKVSFERGIVTSGCDTITLLDDFSPAKNKQAATELENKLEAIIRMVGDGSTKSRSNASLEDIRGEGVKGMVALTGELRGKGLSSNLRCLYCEIEKNKVNLEVVSWFQNNPKAYTTLIQHFVYFLSANWESIILKIKNQFDPMRRMAESMLNERRLVDTLVTLWLTLDFVGIFLNQYCGESFEQCEQQVRLLKCEMVSVVVMSEMSSQQENPAQVFINALASMLETQKLRIATCRIKTQEIADWDGFYENGYLYLLPDEGYQKVTAYLRSGGLYWSVDRNQMGAVLCSEGYAIATSNGLNKKTYYARLDLGAGKKVQFLKIPIAKIYQPQNLEGEN